MDVTANLTGTNTFPWMEAVIAFSSAGEMSNINRSVQIGSVETYVAAAGCLMVVGLCYQVGTDPGSRTVSDTMANTWTASERCLLHRWRRQPVGSAAVLGDLSGLGADDDHAIRHLSVELLRARRHDVLHDLGNVCL